MDGPIWKNKTFFLFKGEKYREGTPAPQNSTTPTAAMKNGDFSGLVDAQGRQIVIYDPNSGRDVTACIRATRSPATGFPPTASATPARAIMQYYPDPNYTTAGAAPWQNNLDYPEHFNKDVFWNWVGKVDHNFGANDRAFFRWGENERNEVRNTTPIRSGPAQNGQLPLWRANRALVGDWVHIFGAGTVFNLRASYTYLPRLELFPGRARVRFDDVRLALGSRRPDAKRGDRRHLPSASKSTSSSRLSRGIAPNRNRNYTIQPNVSLTRGAHNIRSGLDLRWTNVYQRELQQLAAASCSSTALSRAAP